MKRKSKVKNWVINLFLLLLFIVGIALIFNNQIKNYLLRKQGETYSVAQVTKEEVQQNLQKEASFDFAAVVPVSIESVVKMQLENKVLPVIGGVAIPSVEINLPIFKGLGNTEICYGAGTFFENQVMGEGNYSLASHRIDGTDILFTHLDQVNIGDLVYLTDLESVYTYKVSIKENIDPSRVEVIENVPGKKLVTLITCGEREAITRWWIQGELISKTSVKTATTEILKAFEMEQKTF